MLKQFYVLGRIFFLLVDLRDFFPEFGSGGGGGGTKK